MYRVPLSMVWCAGFRRWPLLIVTLRERQLNWGRSCRKSSWPAALPSRYIRTPSPSFPMTSSCIPQDLAIEKQWRSSLQMEVQREKDRVVDLTSECKKVKTLKKVRTSTTWVVGVVWGNLWPQDHTELQEKYVCLQETVSEQEIALVEMGRQLSLWVPHTVDLIWPMGYCTVRLHVAYWR